MPLPHVHNFDCLLKNKKQECCIFFSAATSSFSYLELYKPRSHLCAKGPECSRSKVELSEMGKIKLDFFKNQCWECKYIKHDLVDGYGISVSQMTTDICSTCRKHFTVLSSFTTYYRVCNQINTTGATSGAGNAYPSGAPDFTPSFQWGSCYSIFICMFCKLLFVLLSFFFWPLCCLFIFDIWIMIAPLVSSNSSYHFDKQIQVCTNEDLIVYGV